ncbi:MAG: DNA methyltransferase [Polyangia bacterium]|jgi:16S rRNA G966 N2-methylase RsmD
MNVASQRSEPEAPLIDQEQLNIEEKVRSNLFAWRGQFSPQLVEAHLKSYTRTGNTVLDPFSGSGTVLVESARLRLAAYATDINPAAVAMSRVYQFSNSSMRVRQTAINEVEDLLPQGVFTDDLPLFSRVPSRRDLRQEMSDIINRIDATSLVGILMTALMVRLDFYTGPVLPSDLRSAWRALQELALSLPSSDAALHVDLADARALPIPDKTIDLVFTSPPYINVFNYHQQYRASMEACGWDLLDVARSEIGSNRKHRSNRFLTVVQYCLDMAQALADLQRVCRPDGRIVLIMGRESNVRKTAFYNAAILVRIATECLGMVIVLEQERVFTNRFGQSIFEDILHLRPQHDPPTDVLPCAHSIADETLRDALCRAPRESLADLKEAITRSGDVKPSPMIVTEDLMGRSSHRQRQKRLQHEAPDPTPRQASSNSQ